VLNTNGFALIMRVNVNVLLMLKVIMATGLGMLWGFGFCRIAIVVNTTIETVVTGLTVCVVCVGLVLAGMLILHHTLDADV